jgi:hypothetical protein
MTPPPLFLLLMLLIGSCPPLMLLLLLATAAVPLLQGPNADALDKPAVVKMRAQMLWDLLLHVSAYPSDEQVEALVLRWAMRVAASNKYEVAMKAATAGGLVRAQVEARLWSKRAFVEAFGDAALQSIKARVRHRLHANICLCGRL